MSLGSFIVRRLLLIIPVLVGITCVTFLVSHAVPADPIAAKQYGVNTASLAAPPRPTAPSASRVP